MAAPNQGNPPIPPKEEQLYPPPPPGPPPAQQQVSQTENTAAAYELPTQHFPPPPPGPPPAQQPQFLSQSQEPHAVPQQHPPTQQFPPAPAPAPLKHTNEAPIPEYNPANPQFAPPPTDAVYEGAPPSDDEKAHHHGFGHGHGHGQTHVGQAHQSTEQKPHRGWGDRLAEMGMKAAAPINALANKMGSQSFLPTTMDKECEKAAKILKSFCKEGITSDLETQQVPATTQPVTTATSTGGKQTATEKQKTQKDRGAIVKIPSKVIAKAKGLAIFTTARVGYGVSGATGSGVLIARLPDGSWSPPSGIQVHAVGAGFMIGVDIYDCVCVINSREALEAFKSTRVSLGPDVAVTAGPYGAGGTLDFGAALGGEEKKIEEQKASGAAAVPSATGAASSVPPTASGAIPPTTATTGNPAEADQHLKPDQKSHKRSSSSSLKPVFSYVKSRGFYAGVQVDGTVVTERKDANAAFYGQKVSVDQILKGEIHTQSSAGMWPAGAKTLYEALKIAETPMPGEAQLITPTTAAGTGDTHQLPLHTAPPPAQAVPPQGQQQIPPQYQQHVQQVPGAVGVPLERHEQPMPIHSKEAEAVPTSATTRSEEPPPPPYVEDGVARPDVGDNKTVLH